MNNRIIKFRVWDAWQKCWNDPALYTLGTLAIWNHSDNGPIAQQYTGYNDADGNEIYEGDILKNLTPHKYSPNTFIVEWGEFEPSDDMGLGGVGFVMPWFSRMFKPKIIGNIFENPELLK